MRQPLSARLKHIPAGRNPQRLCTAVIIAYNSGRFLQPAVASARQAGAGHIIVIDNNSLDDSVTALRATAGDVRIVRLAENTGFAAAANLGAQLAKTPYVLLLNDDAVIEKDYIALLVDALESKPWCASAQGKLLLGTGGSRKIDSAGIRLDRYALRPTDRGQGEQDVGQYDQPGYIFAATGAAAMYRREHLVGPLGGFDASFFAYYEDVDLGWRLGRLGHRHWYEPKAVAIHARRGPTAKPPAVVARAFVNRYRAYVRNESLWTFMFAAPVALPWEAARLLRVGRRSPRLLAAILRRTPGIVAKQFSDRV